MGILCWKLSSLQFLSAPRCLDFLFSTICCDLCSLVSTSLFCKYIYRYATQTMNSNDYCDPLTFETLSYIWVKSLNNHWMDSQSVWYSTYIDVLFLIKYNNNLFVQLLLRPIAHLTWRVPHWEKGFKKVRVSAMLQGNWDKLSQNILNYYVLWSLTPQLSWIHVVFVISSFWEVK